MSSEHHPDQDRYRIPVLDDSVLQEAIGGAEWAWIAIYRQLHPSVVGYLRARGSTEPEDLTGEVFLQVVRSLPKFSGDATGFRSWVFVIAHNKLNDDRRRRNRYPTEPVPTFDEARPDAADVEMEALGNVGAEHLRRAISHLTQDQADVLLLRIFGGLSLQEVAAALHKRLTAVKALQHRGLAALRKELTPTRIPVDARRNYIYEYRDPMR
ncbi:MAG TPA: RNA polymerase sigma factor [Actinomycetota bacterium]|nr:RNA polymerase sigma factor [Actinomycetota bacterium]